MEIDKAPLLDVDRRRLPEFKEYFSQRKWHFQEIFNMVYSETNIVTAWRQARGIKHSLLRG